MAITHCVYCNKEITTRSKEHVIQNALGGHLESTDICCPECNNYVSLAIDKPFTTIFNPILDHIPDFIKTANNNSNPPYNGTVKYNGKIYDATFKNKKPISCPELAKELRCNVSKFPLEPVSYKFELDNDAFKTGMAKIAFNYALACGVNFEILRPGLAVEKTDDKVSKITFNYPTLPFYPMNPLDHYLELNSPMTMYHNMILYSQFNCLWCYIDLFNTFQYYVLLSENLPDWAGIYHDYMQTIQKIDRTVPEIEIFRPKDAMIYAQIYGVEPTMDSVEMTRRVRNAIDRKSNRMSMEQVISQKFREIPLFDMAALIKSQPYQAYAAMHLYFDENDRLQPGTFRTQTPYNNGLDTVPYTDAITVSMKNDLAPLRAYTQSKAQRLFAHLNDISKRK